MRQKSLSVQKEMAKFKSKQIREISVIKKNRPLQHAARFFMNGFALCLRTLVIKNLHNHSKISKKDVLGGTSFLPVLW